MEIVSTVKQTYIIYLITNLITSKVYIGKTKTNLKKRANNGEGYKGCSYLYNAIQKYGWDKFTHEIIMELKDYDDEILVGYWEDYYIKVFDSKNPEVGYNLKDGGSDGNFSKESNEELKDIRLDNKFKKMAKELNELLAVTEKYRKGRPI